MEFENPNNWFHLPYRETEVRGRKIYQDSVTKAFALSSPNAGWDGVWMTTDWRAISDLLSQIELASGRVLCTGLGLGLIPLLVAEKDTVREVVVVENDLAIIEMFELQGFDRMKIKIEVSDIETYEDTFGFDSILMDHYNDTGEDAAGYMLAESRRIRANTNSPHALVVPYLWQRTGKDGYLPGPNETAIELRKSLGLNHEQIQKYTKLDKWSFEEVESIVRALKTINGRRK